MEKLIEQFMVQDETDTDAGVVSIEYVLVAVAIAAGVAAVFATGLWTTLQNALNNLF